MTLSWYASCLLYTVQFSMSYLNRYISVSDYIRITFHFAKVKYYLTFYEVYSVLFLSSLYIIPIQLTIVKGI